MVCIMRHSPRHHFYFFIFCAPGSEHSLTGFTLARRRRHIHRKSHWLCGLKKNRRPLASTDLILVPRTGLEPVSPIGHYHLKVACLPIPPPRHSLHLTDVTSSQIRTDLIYFGTSLLGTAGFCAASICGLCLDCAGAVRFSHLLFFGVLLLLILPRTRLIIKKTVARIAVVRVRKFAEPVEPNRVAEAPAPKEAPMSAPFPCWSIIRLISAMATKRKIINSA